jgi:hypothetical protein
MNAGRRFFLSSLVVAFAGTTSLFAGPQRRGTPARIPQGSDGGVFGGPQDRVGDIPAAPAPDPTARLQESQKNLRKDADRLFELAKDLKEEVDKTEQTSVLSLALVKKAEEVEKLAHHIKDLVRAA